MSTFVSEVPFYLTIQLYKLFGNKNIATSPWTFSTNHTDSVTIGHLNMPWPQCISTWHDLYIATEYVSFHMPLFPFHTSCRWWLTQFCLLHLFYFLNTRDLKRASCEHFIAISASRGFCGTALYVIFIDVHATL